MRQLEGAALDRTFTDKAPAKDTDSPELAALLRFVRDRDSVVVHSMDRLARNLDDLRRLVAELTGRGVRVEFVTESLVFTGEDPRGLPRPPPVPGRPGSREHPPQLGVGPRRAEKRQSHSREVEHRAPGQCRSTWAPMHRWTAW